MTTYYHTVSGSTLLAPTVNANHIIEIYNGGKVSGGTILSGGDVRVYDGGVASNMVISAVGYMHVDSGGKAWMPQLSGGRLYVYDIRCR